MTRVAIVTDSTAYLPEELVQQYNIRVIPLNVIFGTESYLDDVDIKANEFYERLQNLGNNPLPTTSQPSAGAFRDLYQEVAKEADEIVSIHISSGLSGTIASALQARDMLPDLSIHVMDSQLTSIGLALTVLEAARAVEAGDATAEEAKAAAEKVISNLRLYFAVDTLHYLHMGGRIGGGSAFLGAALGIKPILELAGGKIEAAGKVRSMKRAIPKLVDTMVEHFGEGATVRAGTISAINPEGAQDLAERLQKRFNCIEMLMTDLSPAIGTHVGPGTVGVAVYPA